MKNPANSANNAPRGGSSVWVNRTLCQGFCDASGVTVTIELGGIKAGRELCLKFQAVDGPRDVEAIVKRVEAALKAGVASFT